MRNGPYRTVRTLYDCDEDCLETISVAKHVILAAITRKTLIMTGHERHHESQNPWPVTDACTACFMILQVAHGSGVIASKDMSA